MNPRQKATAYARLFEAAHEGVFIGSIGREGESGDRTHAVNPYLKRLLGLPPNTPDDAVRPFSSAHLGVDARLVLVDQLVQHGTLGDQPIPLHRSDGSTIWVEVTARAEGSRQGQHLHIEALVRDVSERRQRDLESRDLARELQHAERMAALGQTISGVAHELNNPLATILSWAERLSERPLDDTSRRGASVILTEAERAARIVRNLLTFARKRQSTRTPVDLNAVVRETLSLRQQATPASRLTIRCELEDGLPQVLADVHQLQQIVHNLVTNAEQAMLDANGRGRLSVRTWADRDSRHAVLEVTDDGPGIPAHLHQRVFDPFFTTKAVGHGTGLGLTWVYALVEEHGGRVRIVSPPGGGTTFLVELPTYAVPGTQRTEGPTTSADAVDLRGTRLLLVEDEAALAGAVTEALTDAGLVVDNASDGQDALARLRHGSYDAIVCDLKMPRVDGMMLYRAIASATPTLARRVIFVTGAMAGTDAERFLAETGNRWLAKPFRLADLLRAVRETLA